MKRTDYLIVARALRYSQAPPGTNPERLQWERDCEYLALAFSQQSASFDRALFLENCGVNQP